MEVLSVIPYWGPEFGGQFVNAANITANLMLKGHEAPVITTSKTPGKFGSTYPWRAGGETLDLPLCVSKCYEDSMRISAEFARRFAELARKCDIVLIHGLWRFPTSFASSFCRRRRIPYVTFTHVMMSEWSLAHNGLLKRIYFRLFEKKNLDGAAAIAFMDAGEGKTIEKNHPDARCFLFRNALNAGDLFLAKKTRDLRKKAPSDTVNLLYLSRIHPKKGAILLVGAVKELLKETRKIRLIIAGPAEDRRYLRKIQGRIKASNLGECISIAGTVSGEEKKRLFGKADIFILPSSGDAKPLAVLEAMGYGIPVVVTPGCNMPEVADSMGYVAEQNPVAIAEAAKKLIKDPGMAGEMGMRGHRYVARDFTWERRIDELLGMLREITGGNRK